MDKNMLKLVKHLWLSKNGEAVMTHSKAIQTSSAVCLVKNTKIILLVDEPPANQLVGRISHFHKCFICILYIFYNYICIINTIYIDRDISHLFFPGFLKKTYLGHQLIWNHCSGGNMPSSPTEKKQHFANGKRIPSLKLTNIAPENRLIDPWKFGDSYWKPPFLGANC